MRPMWIVLVLLALVSSTAPAAAGILRGLVKDASGKPVGDAVIYAILASGARAVASRPARAVLDQADREFVPHVKPVQVGTEVSFPNRDDIRHHVYSFSPAKTFELPLYRGTPARPVKFDRPGVVVLGCNIHDWMLGYLLVLDTPYFDTTGPDGVARIEKLPPGAYDVRVWHPRMKDAEQAAPQRLTIASDRDEQRAQFTLGLKPEWRLRRAPTRAGDRYR